MAPKQTTAKAKTSKPANAKKPAVKKAATKASAAKAAPKKAATVKTKAPAKTVKAAVKKTPVKQAVKKTVSKKAVAAPKAVKAKAKAAPAGLPEQARDIVLRVLDERQAEQIVTIDLRGRSSMADYLIIASGRAARQIAAIADLVQAELAKIGIKRVRAEGTGEGNWVLVDAGDIILHLFRPEVRHFYNIEQIYGEDVPA